MNSVENDSSGEVNALNNDSNDCNSGNMEHLSNLKDTESTSDLFLSACRIGNDLGIRALLQSSMPSLAKSCNKNGQSGLSLACSTGNIAVIRTLVQSSAVDVNIADNEGNTPLMIASQAGYDEIVRFFLFHMNGEVDVHAQNCSGFTALMKASLHGRTNCCRMLILGGADVTMTDWGRRLRADQWAARCGMKETLVAIRSVSKCALSREDLEQLKWDRKTSTATDIYNWLERKISRALKLKQKNWSTQAGALYHLASGAYNMHGGICAVNYTCGEEERKETVERAIDINTIRNSNSSDHEDEKLVITMTYKGRQPPSHNLGQTSQTRVQSSNAVVPLVRLTHASPVLKRKSRRGLRDVTMLQVPRKSFKKKVRE